MNRKEHIERHKLLHMYLDEIVADYISTTGKTLSETNLIDLLGWSSFQTIAPSEPRLYPHVTCLEKDIMLDLKNKLKMACVWLKEYETDIYLKPDIKEELRMFIQENEKD